MLRRLAESRGFFTRSEALDTGERDRDLVGGVARGELVRIKHGYYTYADLWRGKNAEDRHLTLAAAVQHAHGEPGRDEPHHGSPRPRCHCVGGRSVEGHVTRLDAGAGRVEKDSVHHEGQLDDGDVQVVNGLRVLPADRCVVEAASIVTSEQSLVLFDSFLHKEAR